MFDATPGGSSVAKSLPRFAPSAFKCFSGIYYIPRFEKDESLQGLFDGKRWHFDPYTDFQNQLAAAQRAGTNLYSVKRRPGRYLAGGTITPARRCP